MTARLALALSAAALALSAAAFFTRPAPAPCVCAEMPPADGIADTIPAPKPDAIDPIDDAGAIHAIDDIAHLSARVAALEARSPPPEKPSQPPPTIVEVRPPHPALTVTAAANGSLAVENTDPALAGQVMTVEVVTADGAVERRRVTVPAPR